MSKITRVRNQPKRFCPESKEYKYKNDRYDNSFDPKGNNVFWGRKQAPNINGRDIYQNNFNESDNEFIASDTEPMEYDEISSEEELTDSECESVFSDSELECESVISDSEYEFDCMSLSDSEQIEELNETNLKRLSTNTNSNSSKRMKY